MRIGTRGSPLAVRQTELTIEALIGASAATAMPDALEIVRIKTTGDRITDRPLAELGGKGLFTKELDRALLEGTVDLAVHSMKDVETALPDGLVVAAYLPRADPRDRLIANGWRRIADLPEAAVVGTASLRRRAQLLAARPDLRPVLLRGNVQTRLARIASGEIVATLLAAAGLDRLGITEGETLAPSEMLPAVAQGAVGIACRADDHVVRDLLALIDDRPTRVAVVAERAMLARLDGSCRTPIAGLAEIADGGLRLRGLVASPDGSRIERVEVAGDAADAARLGDEAGRRLHDLFGPLPG